MALAWVDTIFKWLGHGRYNATPPTLANGAVGELQLDSGGNLRVNIAASTEAGGGGTQTVWVDSTASGASKVVKATAGRLYQIFGTNDGSAKVWVQIFDANSLPANGTVPKLQLIADIAATWSIEFARAREFQTGIVWAASSTPAVLTLATGALLWSNSEII